MTSARQRPGERISIEILNGAQVVATVEADQFRDDLLKAGKGDGAHGFLITLPEPGVTGRLGLRCKGGDAFGGAMASPRCSFSNSGAARERAASEPEERPAPMRPHLGGTSAPVLAERPDEGDEHEWLLLRVHYGAS